jgi:hypothetical protein
VVFPCELPVAKERSHCERETRIEIEGEILADVEKEMQKPRLTESVRNGLSVQAAQAAKNVTRTLSRSTAFKRRQAENSLTEAPVHRTVDIAAHCSGQATTHIDLTP